MHSHGRHALAAFLMPRRSVTARGPHAAAFPASIRIVDAAIETLGVEAGWVRHLHGNHFAISESDQAVVEVARRDWNVIAKPERIMLVHPGVIARLRAVVADACKAWAGEFVERPALRAMIAGRRRPVQRTFAFGAIETAQVSAGQRYPDHPL